MFTTLAMSYGARRPSHRGAAVLLSVVTALTACGGGSSSSGAGDASARRGEAQSAVPQALQPLFDQRGQPLLSPAELVPADTSARTRNGLYATVAQLEWEELTAAPYTVLLDVDAVGTVANTVQLAEVVRGWRDTRGLSFFVRAKNPLDAAAVVNILADAGFAPVFMVL